MSSQKPSNSSYSSKYPKYICCPAFKEIYRFWSTGKSKNTTVISLDFKNPLTDEIMTFFVNCSSDFNAIKCTIKIKDLYNNSKNIDCGILELMNIPGSVKTFH